MNDQELDRRTRRLFAVVTVAAAIGLLMGLGFGVLLLQGQGAHDEQAEQDKTLAEQNKVLTEETKSLSAANAALLARINDCLNPEGECARQAAAARQAQTDDILAGITRATDNLLLLTRDNHRLRDALAAADRTRAAESAAAAARFDALAARLEAIQAAQAADRPVPPPTPTQCVLLPFLCAS